MVPRIWLYRLLCRNKPYERLITTDSCSPLGCFRPQSVDDGETVCLKQDLTRYWLGHVIGPCDWCPSPLNLEGSRYIHSRDDDEEHGPWTVFNSEESSHYPKDDYSDFPSKSNAYEVACVRYAGPVIRSSSGLDAILPPQRRIPSVSNGIPFRRTCATNTSGIGSHISTKEEKLSPFIVIEGDTESLLNRIDAAIKEKEHEFTLDALKERYEKHVKPQLDSRGLVLPSDLHHQSTKFVHFRTKDIFGRRPTYMTALDVMGHEKRMKLDEWNCFLAYMVKARVYVIEKWDLSISHVETLMYDHGIIPPDDGTDVEFHKAECDAAFDEKTNLANLSFLIFKGRRIIHSQVFYDVPCETSVIAEAYAAIALLETSHEIGIRKLLFWTDYMAIHEVASGEWNMRFGDKNLGVSMMLREQMKCFDKVISMWKGREVNQFAEDLATLDKEETLSATFPHRALSRWKYQLEGSPIFRFKQKSDIDKIIKRFVDNQSFGQGRATSNVMLDVGKVCKFEILLGLQQGFDPDDLCVAVHDFDRKPHDLKLKFIELLGKPREISGITEGIIFFHKYHIQRGGQRNFTMKSMVVLFDAKLWKESFHRSHLMVVLMSPKDADPFARRSLRKISAVDYARFYQTK